MKYKIVYYINNSKKFIKSKCKKKKKKKIKKIKKKKIPDDCSKRLIFPLRIVSDKLFIFLVAISIGSGNGNVPKSSKCIAFLYKFIYFSSVVFVIFR